MERKKKLTQEEIDKDTKEFIKILKGMQMQQ